MVPLKINPGSSGSQSVGVGHGNSIKDSSSEDESEVSALFCYRSWELNHLIILTFASLYRNWPARKKRKWTRWRLSLDPVAQNQLALATTTPSKIAHQKMSLWWVPFLCTCTACRLHVNQEGKRVTKIFSMLNLNAFIIIGYCHLLEKEVWSEMHWAQSITANGSSQRAAFALHRYN